MRLHDMSEFGLIERIRNNQMITIPDVIIGIGDDAAVLRQNGDRQLVMTTDMMMEEVHFSRRTALPYHIGYKALAINLSDIAAMAAVPRYFLVAIALPKDWTVEEVDELYRGMNDLATVWGLNLIGGDTVGSPNGLVINITCVGEVEPGKAVTRSGAKQGDLLVVTNDIGASAAGLAVLGNPDLPWPPDMAAEVVERHLLPSPQLGTARILAGREWMTSLNDISDGLASEVLEIAKASNVGIRLYGAQIPIANATKIIARQLGHDPMDWALNGGEDYQLLMSMSPDVFEQARSILLSATEIMLTEIGEVVAPEEGHLIIDAKGRSKELTATGYDHFRK